MNRVIARLQKGRLPEFSITDGGRELERPLESLSQSLASLEDARSAFAAIWASEEQRILSELLVVAQRPRFREALAWQNRNALVNGLDIYAQRCRRAGGTGQAGRRNLARLVASYLQRYCAKNDSIGFFGPVGWSVFGEGVGSIQVPRRVAAGEECEVLFEQWFIDAIADAIAKRYDLYPWVAPQSRPFVSAHGIPVHPSAGGCSELAGMDLEVFQLCRGGLTAIEIGRQLEAVGVLDAAENVFPVLHRLKECRLIRWRLQLPKALRPEEHLRARLLKVEDECRRGAVLAELDQFVELRRRLAGARGDAQSVQEAMKELEQMFVRGTGREPTRMPGITYGARTPVYLECKRDGVMALDKRLLEWMAPVALVLDSLRWVSYHVGKHYREVFRRCYDNLGWDRSAAAGVPFALLFEQGLLLTSDGTVRALIEEAQRRWRELLGDAVGQGHHALLYRLLAPRVREAFESPAAGWGFARYQCPDVMIRAASPEAIERGECELVLGEVHGAVNSVAKNALVWSHPCPDELRASLAADLPHSMLLPALPRYDGTGRGPEACNLEGLRLALRGSSVRLENPLLKPEDVLFRFANEPSLEGQCSIDIGDLSVRERGDGLVVTTNDGSREHDILEPFTPWLSASIVKEWSLLPPAPHRPRVQVDRVILQRESWQLPACDFQLGGCKTGDDRFLAVRRLAARLGLPRHLFVSTRSEDKPLPLDLCSPPSVEVLAKVLGQGEDGDADCHLVRLEEMLPEPGCLWVTDARGRHYTSELRMVAVDESA